MILRQFLHTDPVVAASYLFGCGGKAVGAVVDPVTGAVCGRGLSGKPVSTIGFERRFNRAFAIASREAFLEHMLQEIPPRPPRAAENRAADLGLEAGVG